MANEDAAGSHPKRQHDIDDMIIATDAWEEHLGPLKRILERMRHTGIKVKPSKSEIGRKAKTFLGN